MKVRRLSSYHPLHGLPKPSEHLRSQLLRLRIRPSPDHTASELRPWDLLVARLALPHPLLEVQLESLALLLWPEPRALVCLAFPEGLGQPLA